MHVFQVKGISGLLLLLLAVLGVVALVLVLPSVFMMVLWNAVIFEGLKGPVIDLEQGFYLWGATLILLKLIFRPEIKFQMMNGHSPEHRELRRKMLEQAKQQAEKKEEAEPTQAADAESR